MAHVPWDDETWEKWLIARHVGDWPVDRVFEIHKWATRPPDVIEALKQVAERPVPPRIFVRDASEVDIDLACETYPLFHVFFAVKDLAGPCKDIEYPTYAGAYTEGERGSIPGSAGYMLAHAIQEWNQAERPSDWEIGIWGISMTVDSQWGPQRSQFEYLIGLARGSGLRVYVPPESDLLKGNYAYGYDSDRETGFPEDMLQARVMFYRQQIRQVHEAAVMVQGQMKELEHVAEHVPDAEDRLSKHQNSRRILLGYLEKLRGKWEAEAELWKLLQIRSTGGEWPEPGSKEWPRLDQSPTSVPITIEAEG
jgi:hypothetical protein